MTDQTAQEGAEATTATAQEGTAPTGVERVAKVLPDLLNMPARLVVAPAAVVPPDYAARPVGTKRMMAMHIGYVGTAFNGLQAVRSLPVEATIECVLERALLRARMISADNYGDLFKIKWSRSSRTDKGVHSLGTVIAAKLVVDEERFPVSDGEGVALAAAINAHLPPAIRVFTVQRVNGKFSARWTCRDRTYDFYLPAHILDLNMDGGEQDAATVATLRSTLAALVGRHAFHNYVGRRREYMTDMTGRPQRAVAPSAAATGPSAQPGLAPGVASQERSHASSAAGAPPPAPPPVASTSTAAAGKTAAAGGAAPAGGAVAGGSVTDILPAAPRRDHFSADKNHRPRGNYKGKDKGRQDLTAADRALAEPDHAAAVAAALAPFTTDGGVGTGPRVSTRDERKGKRRRDREEGGGGGGGGGGDAVEDDDDRADGDEEDESAMYRELANAPAASQRFVQSCYWQSAVDPTDKVGVKHYRDIISFTADDPAPLVPGGVPCLRIQVRGLSFMLHQIRHMIGAAVACARGQVGLDLILASLAAPARVAMPRMPPHTLLLSGSAFSPFRTSGDDESSVVQASGEQLALREAGAAASADFQKQVLNTTLNELLTHPDWKWFRAGLVRQTWPQEGQRAVLDAHVLWAATASERRRDGPGRDTE